MSINVTSNFREKSAKPIEDKMVVADLTARDAIDSSERFEGLYTYSVADKKTYQLQGGITNGDWVDVSGGGTVSLTATQVAYGSGTNTIASDANYTYISGTKQLNIGAVLGDGLINTYGFYKINDTAFALGDVENTYLGFGSFTTTPNSGLDNTQIGYNTGGSNASNYNTFVGSKSGSGHGAGDGNVGIGYQAITGDINGSYNIGIGFQAGASLNSAGGKNNLILIGKLAGYEQADVDHIISIGENAGWKTQTAEAIFIGHDAGGKQSSTWSGGGETVAIGHEAGFGNQGAEVVMIGHGAGYANTGINSVLIGSGTGSSSAAGAYNTGNYVVAIGHGAQYNGAGDNTIVIGKGAGVSNNGDDTILIGTDAGPSNAGTFNIFIGNTAGFYNTSGYSDVYIGVGSGGTNATATNVTAIGNSSATGFAGGDWNTYLGTNTSCAVAGKTGSTALGSLADITKDYQIVFGNQYGGTATVNWRINNIDYNWTTAALPGTGTTGHLVVDEFGALTWAAGSGGMAIGGLIGSGTPGSVLFVNNINQLGQDNAHFFWDQSAAALAIGSQDTTLNVNTVARQAKFLVKADDPDYADIGAIRYSSTNPGVGGAILFGRVNGTIAAPTTITTGENIGGLIGASWDGTEFRNAGGVFMYATGTITTAQVPTIMYLDTAREDTGLLGIAMTINQNQNVGIGTTLLTGRLLTVADLTATPVGVIGKGIVITGGAGGDDDNIGGAGDGGAVSMFSRDGGAADTMLAGNGGALTLYTGVGGFGSATIIGGNSGDFNINTGTGGGDAGAGAGNAGGISIIGGAGGDAVTFAAGSGSVVQIKAGNGGQGTAGLPAGNGSDLLLYSGKSGFDAGGGPGTDGAVKLVTSRFETTQGADATSGTNTLVLGADGNVFKFHTGTGSVDYIDITGWQPGSTIILMNDGVGGNMTLNHASGGAGQIFLAASVPYTMVSPANVTLVLIGDYWYETARMAP